MPASACAKLRRCRCRTILRFAANLPETRDGQCAHLRKAAQAAARDGVAAAGATGRHPAWFWHLRRARRRPENQPGLATAGKFQINICQQFAVEQRAVMHAARIIDPKRRHSASSEAGAPGKRFRAMASVSITGLASNGARPHAKLGIQKFHIKSRVVNDQRVAADKFKNPSTISANFGLSAKNASLMPCTASASGDMARSGLI